MGTFVVKFCTIVGSCCLFAVANKCMCLQILKCITLFKHVHLYERIQILQVSHRKTQLLHDE